MKADIVIDLGFGDAGKGITVANLCRKGTVVVRFSGGQQAGHTVIHNEWQHIHSSFGSGTMLGCPTFFTEDTTFYPPCINNELNVLNDKGFIPELIIHPAAMVTTPYDVAFNRVREAMLRHGSCGLGVGATMTRNLTGYKLSAADLAYDLLTKSKLSQIKDYYKKRVIDEIPPELHMVYMKFVSEQEASWERCLFDSLFEIGHMPVASHYVFEGSQGIALDMDHGTFPNVTYANTTSKNAIKWCERLGADPSIYYVTRCYGTRHGEGWVPNEDEVKLINNKEEINVTNEWQGAFKTFRLSRELLKWAINIDSIYAKRVTYWPKLVVTCLDQRPYFDVSKLRKLKLPIYTNDSPETGNLHSYNG